MKGKLSRKVITMLFIVMLLVCTSAALVKQVIGADNEQISIESNLEKYINYNLSDTKKGTLVQYNLKEEIKYQENHTPVKSTETTVNLKQIDGLFADDVKVLNNNALADYTYDNNSGVITIKGNNEIEQYTLICNYDTYSEEKTERDLSIEASEKVILAEDDREVTGTQNFENKATEDIGTLISVNSNVEDIYNGKIKSNLVNGTQYGTTYKENEQIMVSKKDAQDKIQYVETNKDEDKVKFNSTTLYKQDVINVLGEDGTVEIQDKDNNVLATINKDTQYDEQGKFTYTYENEINSIKIKTSNIVQEGIINIESTKEIKAEMQDVNKKSFDTSLEIAGINVEKENVIDDVTKEQKEQDVEKVAFGIRGNKTAEIKDATTNIDLEMSQTTWTNEKQNDLTFSVKLNGSNEKYNMLNNPQITIELPDEVEKVILGNSKLLLSDNLKLEDTSVKTNDNGKQCIVATISGTQTEYKGEDSTILPTINIEATIILKKDIEVTEAGLNLLYTNQCNAGGAIDKGTIQKNIKIENYQDETSQDNSNLDEKLEKIYTEAVKTGVAEQSADETQKINGLNLEVTPVKGDKEIKSGDPLYEGEYIKYNFKVTNTNSEEVRNVKIVGDIPEGTVYGELSARPLAEGENKACYEYNFDESLKQKEIVVGTMKAGDVYQGYYEVKVQDLQDVEEKAIQSNLQVKVGEAEGAKYSQENTVKKAEIKIFLQSFMGELRDNWYYQLVVDNPSGKETNVELKLPQGYEFEYICGPLNEDQGVASGLKWEDDRYEVKDNVVSTKVTTSGNYIFGGSLKRENLSQEGKNGQIEVTASATAETDSAEYKSNENRIQYTYEDVAISMTSETEGEEVPYNSEITYNINIKNIGKTTSDQSEYNAVEVNLEDYLPEELLNKKVHYENYKRVDNNGTTTFTKEEKDESIVSSTDENGVKTADLNLLLTIPYGESVTVKVTGTTDYVTEKTEIQNSATVSGDYIKSKTSNIVKHYIMPKSKDSDEPIIPDNPDKPDNPNNPTNPDNPNGGNDQEDNNKTYSISGLAWLDANQDGQRQSTEKMVSGVSVMLVDKAEGLNVKAITTTAQDGKYQFDNLKYGNYMVVFKYNTSLYGLTKYQQSGVSTDVNSDAIANNISVNGESFTGGITDTIKLNASKGNIDIGLIGKEQGKIKIDKYINKVTVRTNKNEKVQSYSNAKLAKADIRAKEIKGSVVTAQYKIVVTNSGEGQTLVGTIVDDIPDGFEFNSANNSNWKVKNGNKIINTSLANKKIEAGESVELLVTLTKSMDENSTGTFTNIAYSENNENDSSQADLIISVSTGLVTYISIGFISLLIVGGIVYITRKHGISKIAKILSVMVIGITLGIINIGSTFAAWAPDSAHFAYTWDHGLEGSHNGYAAYFYGRETSDGICVNTGVTAAGEVSWGTGPWMRYSKSYSVGTSSSQSQYDSITDFYMTGNTDRAIGVKNLNGEYLYGPFTVNSSYAGGIGLTIYDKSGNVITNYSTCDANGNYKSIQGSCEFYIKIPAAYATKGISYIKANMARYGIRTITTTKYGNVVYIYSRYYQNVRTKGQYTIGETSNSYNISYSHDLTWTNFNSTLDILKQDADDLDVPIEISGNIRNENGTWSQDFKTTNGKVHYDNIPAGTYIIKETVNNNYGYESNVGKELTVYLRAGETQVISMTNEKQTGALELKKIDADSNKPMKDVGFKVSDGKGTYLVAVDENDQEQTTVNGKIYLSEMKSTKNKEEATLFVTGEDGLCTIYNIRIGKYTVEETYLGNEWYNYELDDSYINWVSGSTNNNGPTATVEVVRQRSYNTTTETNIIKDNQKTIDDGLYQIETGVSSSYALDVGYANTYDKTNVWIHPKNNSIAQQFYAKYLGNGQYKIVYIGAGKCLDVNGGIASATNGTNVQLFTDNGSDAQKWTIQKSDNGYYKLKLGNTNLYMDVDGGRAEAYTNVQVYSGNTSNAQKFKFNTLATIPETGRTATNITFKNTKKYINLSGYVWEDMISGKTSARDNLYNEDEEKNDKLVANVTVRLKDKDGNSVEFKTLKNADATTDAEKYETHTEIRTDADGKYEMRRVLIDKLDEYYVEFEYNGMSYKSVASDLVKANGSKATDDNSRAEFNNSYATIRNNQSLDNNNNKKYDLKYDYKDNTSTLIYGDNPVYGYDGQRFPINDVYNQYTLRANTKDAYIAAKTDENNYKGYLTDIHTVEDIRKNDINEIDNLNLGLYERERSDFAIVEDIDNVKLTLNGYDHIYDYNQRLNSQTLADENNENNGFNTTVKFGSKYKNASYTREVYQSDLVYNMQQGNEGKLQAYIKYKIAIKNETTNLYMTANEMVSYYDNRYEIMSIKDEDGKDLKYTIDNNYSKNGYKKVVIETNQQVAHQKQRNIYIEYKLDNDALNAVLNQDITLNSVSEITSYSTYDDQDYKVRYAGIDKDSNPGTTEPTNKDTYEDDTDSAPSFILHVKNPRVISGTVWEDSAIAKKLKLNGYDKEIIGDGVYEENENTIGNVKVELLKIEGTNSDGTNVYTLAKLYEDNTEKPVKDATMTTGKDGKYEFDGVIPGEYVLRFTYGDNSAIYTTSGEEVDQIKAEDYKSTIYRCGNKDNVGSEDGLWYREETSKNTDSQRLSDARDRTGVYGEGDSAQELDIVEHRTTERTLNNSKAEYERSLSAIKSDTEHFTIRMDYDVNKDNVSGYGADLKFVFDHMDFGIIKRPEQILKITKHIDYIKVTLANGQVIIDGNPQTDNLQHVKLLKDENGNSNIHIEIDSELIQGANVEVRYGITVDNTKAEIDYSDQDYYIYGTKPADKSKYRMATVMNLYDYLSNDLAYDENNDTNKQYWTVVNKKDNSFDWLQTEGYLSEDAFKAFKKYNQVFQTGAFSDMVPGTTKTINMVASKVLSNTTDDMTYGNDVEVTEVKNEPMKDSTPGNYVPTSTSNPGTLGSPDEPDSDNKYITITGPTGENQNYLPYVILGISGLIILGTGIIFIKKKLL